MTLKETVEDLKKIKGNVKGDIILGILLYIRGKSIRVAVNSYRFYLNICKYHAGFMLKIAQLALGKEDIGIKEVNVFLKAIPITNI